MCSTPVVDINLEIASTLIKEAARNNAQLIVLPEMFAIMGSNPSDKIKVREQLGQGKIQSFLSEHARINNVWIVGGTIPIECENKNKIRAASLTYNEKGMLVARYDKIHLFDVVLSATETYKESDTTEPGNEVVVVNTPFGKLGLAVCYDIRFPELFRCLLNKGAEIIAVPAAFTMPTGKAHWELLARSRAVENFCYLIGACQGGIHSDNRETYGHSLIVEPWGNIAAQKNDREPGIIYADIDLKKVYDARKSIPIQAHQRILLKTE
jgi:nitrilase